MTSTVSFRKVGTGDTVAGNGARSGFPRAEAMRGDETATISRGAAFRKTQVYGWQRTECIPTSFILTGSSRCIAADGSMSKPLNLNVIEGRDISLAAGAASRPSQTGLRQSCALCFGFALFHSWRRQPPVHQARL